jgi:hypothetical protein
MHQNLSIKYKEQLQEIGSSSETLSSYKMKINPNLEDITPCTF